MIKLLNIFILWVQLSTDNFYTQCIHLRRLISKTKLINYLNLKLMGDNSKRTISKIKKIEY